MNLMTVDIIPISLDRDPTLIAFCSFTIDAKFQLNDIGLHVRDGAYYLLFPTKRVRNGFIHYFKPIDKPTGETMLQRAVEAYKRAIIGGRDSEVVNEQDPQGK